MHSPSVHFADSIEGDDDRVTSSLSSLAASVDFPDLPSPQIAPEPQVSQLLEEIQRDRVRKFSLAVADRSIVAIGMQQLDDDKEFDRYGFRTADNPVKYTEPKSSKVTQRHEKKWDEMLDGWDKWIELKPSKISERVSKGIPDSRRARAWLVLSGGFALKNAHPAGTYARLLAQGADEASIEQIDKDVPRTFPDHRLLGQDGPGWGPLTDVLRAYAAFNPTVGYCQGMAFIAGTLLIVGMQAEDAFWTITALLSHHMAGYFSPHLAQVRIDISILQLLMQFLMKDQWKHMAKHGAEPLLFATKWFVAGFALSLPWDTVMMIWDRFMFHGTSILFKAAIAILKILQPLIMKAKSFEAVMGLIAPPKPELVSFGILAKAMDKVDLSPRVLVTLHARATARFNQENEKRAQQEREHEERRQARAAAAATEN
eukprot:TRINITY_DN2851_c0_g1_i1.p1 TRINITY_DN2851_c0_g1~~TRINITY_DN2851_c0_g1_i1.p1  ORF type:complete len:428 (+),score=84.34 TRINITY_DN2851_c0_g1_i1:45-1328(+)